MEANKVRGGTAPRMTMLGSRQTGVVVFACRSFIVPGESRINYLPQWMSYSGYCKCGCHCEGWWQLNTWNPKRIMKKVGCVLQCNFGERSRNVHTPLAIQTPYYHCMRRERFNDDLMSLQEQTIFRYLRNPPDNLVLFKPHMECVDSFS